MPAMPQSWPDVLGSVQVSDYMYGTNLPGTTAEEGVLPRVRGGGRGGVAIDASSESTRHGAGVPRRVTPSLPPPLGEAQTYRVYFPKLMLQLRCPVEGCLGGASNWANLRVHFSHHHARDKIVILEEGNLPYPRCPQCDMFVSHRALIGRHLTTDFCIKG